MCFETFYALAHVGQLPDLYTPTIFSNTVKFLDVQNFFQNYKGIFIPDSNIKSDYKSKTKKLTSRKLKRANILFDYLITKSTPVSISELARNIKLNNNSIKNWIELIQYIQSKKNMKSELSLNFIFKNF